MFFTNSQHKPFDDVNLRCYQLNYAMDIMLKGVICALCPDFGRYVMDPEPKVISIKFNKGHYTEGCHVCSLSGLRQVLHGPGT